MLRRILLAEIMHESNTFNRIATTKADFATRYWLEGNDISAELEGTNTEVWGFLEAGRERGWEITHPFAASASPSGPMAASDWAEVKRLICAPLRRGELFDAIILVLHGAMVTQDCADPDGELLAEIRLAAPGTLVAATLDMHANVSEQMVKNADLFMTYRTYPHVDQYDRAQHLAGLIDRVLSERLTLVSSFLRHPMMDAADHGRIDPPGSMNRIIARLGDSEKHPAVICANLQNGFPWADVDHIGPSVVVTGTDEDVCRTFSEELMGLLWDSRTETQLKFGNPEVAMQKALAGRVDDLPLILADFADNPAGGTYGDSRTCCATCLKPDWRMQRLRLFQTRCRFKKLLARGRACEFP